jgi:hypothetical protein
MIFLFSMMIFFMITKVLYELNGTILPQINFLTTKGSYLYGINLEFGKGDTYKFLFALSLYSSTTRYCACINMRRKSL